ncbi:hypothetical protein SKAU_G00215930 [Synaphobranchus kaupii]|uniref:Uncharacterized protein n=1 Tax=Synaphobranchus kaupii TaxID=118154 RepID=A0A9Q1F9T7_SYNKA|nr:hypothetical protein SKAU_G00215930 [Synaphobranchus kaupii]
MKKSRGVGWSGGHAADRPQALWGLTAVSESPGVAGWSTGWSRRFGRRCRNPASPLSDGQFPPTSAPLESVSFPSADAIAAKDTGCQRPSGRPRSSGRIGQHCLLQSLDNREMDTGQQMEC